MASISTISTPNLFCSNHHNAKKFSASSVLQPRLRVSAANAPASTSSNAISRRTSSKSANLEVGSSSSAMEQLDIERGVCIPFRKYTPETVGFFWWKCFDSFFVYYSCVEFGVQLICCCLRLGEE